MTRAETRVRAMLDDAYSCAEQGLFASAANYLNIAGARAMQLPASQHALRHRLYHLVLDTTTLVEGFYNV